MEVEVAAYGRLAEVSQFYTYTKAGTKHFSHNLWEGRGEQILRGESRWLSIELGGNLEDVKD
jgi:hypothetical protein